MKNKVCFFIATLIVLLITSCNSRGNTYHYEEYGLNRPVKSVKVTTYEAVNKFGEIINGGLEEEGNYIAVFNDVGNLESISYYDKNGDLSGVEKYKYNGDNTVSEMSCYMDDGDLLFHRIYEYNNNQISAITHKHYWSWQDKEEIWEEKYKRNGELLVECMFIKNGELSSVTKYTRKGKNTSEWVTYDKEGNTTSRGDEVYNDHDRVVSRNEGASHWEVQWNDKVLPIYLKNAHLINNTDIGWYGDRENCVYYIEYEYDKKGNWIKQVVYEGEVKNPLTISERVIMY